MVCNGECDDDESIGPGWFDSSRELQRGLLVMEGLPEDVELGEWLRFIMAGAPAEAVVAA
jgi:hypothetical protein